MIIDAVITWVDRDDASHLEKMNRFKKKKPAVTPVPKDFNAYNEISYCVRSIQKFAPFIRTIFIVTDEQIPQLHQPQPDNVIIIDHKDFFKGHEQALPTFNIRCIEVMLHRIPGLSEHFLYFNDDFFLIKPTVPDDWFINDKPVLRGEWNIQPDKVWYKKIARFFNLTNTERAGFRKAQTIAAQLAGFERKYFRCYHTPRPLRKSTFENFFTAHPDILEKQLTHRFRSTSQFNPYSLAWHLDIRENCAVFAKHNGFLELHHTGKKSVAGILLTLNRARRNKKIICLNIQALDKASKEKHEAIFNWLESILAN